MKTPITRYNPENVNEYSGRILIVDVPSPTTNRIYPKELMISAIHHFNEELKINPAIGFGVPVNFDLKTGSLLIEHVSHKINRIELINNDMICFITLLDTPKGLMCKKLANMSELYLTLSMNALIIDNIVKECRINTILIDNK